MVRASSSIGLLAFLAASRSTFAKELPVDEVRAAELYDSGYMHEELMARKMVRITAISSISSSSLIHRS